MHLNRQNIGKSWPIPRKGTKYLAVSTHNKTSSIPLVVVMRDVLDLVKTKKELQKSINEKQIKINGKEIREGNYPLGLLDILSVGKKNYKVGLNEHKKMSFEEVSEKDAQTKTIKIVGKKTLGKDKFQFNLIDGRNILSKEKADTGDSVIFNFKDKKIEKIIKMEKGEQGFVFEGKHAGHKGKIEEIIERGGKSLAKVIDEEGKKINVWIKNVIVMEK